MKRYDVLRAEGNDFYACGAALAREVNSALEQGYFVVGGVSLSAIEDSTSTDGRLWYSMAQAIGWKP